MKISDNELIEAYYAALNLALDSDFIQMLQEEIEERNLTYKIKKSVAQQS
ncbi:sporulation histidine kinase inhibitor Sda [Aquibacillus kalidii]|nr:sporulation histidine kinase inhibitor Sda [Aquibacillus kalidii]